MQNIRIEYYVKSVCRKKIIFCICSFFFILKLKKQYNSIIIFNCFRIYLLHFKYLFWWLKRKAHIFWHMLHVLVLRFKKCFKLRSYLYRNTTAVIACEYLNSFHIKLCTAMALWTNQTRLIYRRWFSSILLTCSFISFNAKWCILVNVRLTYNSYTGSKT